MRISSLFHGGGFGYPAALYAVSAPFSKLLLAHIPATLMAGFLYIGAGMGMAAAAFIRKIGGTKKEESRFSAGEIPFVIGMIVLDIAAPVCLMIGLEHKRGALSTPLSTQKKSGFSFFGKAAFSSKQPQLSVCVIVKIALNKNNGSALITASACKVAKGADKVGKLAGSCSLRSHAADKAAAFCFNAFGNSSFKLLAGKMAKVVIRKIFELQLVRSSY